MLSYFLQFNGAYYFKYPLSELEKYVSYLDGTEITVTATVGDRFLDEISSGYSRARIFNSSLSVKFLGGSPQVFKPSMPFKCYVSLIDLYIVILMIWMNGYF